MLAISVFAVLGCAQYGIGGQQRQINAPRDQNRSVVIAELNENRNPFAHTGVSALTITGFRPEYASDYVGVCCECTCGWVTCTCVCCGITVLANRTCFCICPPCDCVCDCTPPAFDLDIRIPNYIFYQGQNRPVVAIAANAFYGCHRRHHSTAGARERLGENHRYRLMSGRTSGNIVNLVIPENVNTIGMHAFSYNTIRTIELPQHMTGTIGDWAFAHNEIEELRIPNGLQRLGWAVFMHNHISCLTLPDHLDGYVPSPGGDIPAINPHLRGLVEMTRNTFQHNHLTTIEFPNSLISMTDLTFANNRLEHLRIPPNLTSLRGSVFRDNQIVGTLREDGVTMGPLIVPNTIAELGGSVFSNNPIAGVVFEENPLLAGIPSDTFRHHRIGSHSHLPEPYYISSAVVIPYGIRTIYQHAFNALPVGQSLPSDYGITSLTLPSNLLEIQAGAFWGNNLSELDIPTSLRDFNANRPAIGNNAFNWNLLTQINVPGNVGTIGAAAFANNRLTAVTLNEGLITIGANAFQADRPDRVYALHLNRIEGTITIPSTVRLIGTSAFIDNYGITGLEFAPTPEGSTVVPLEIGNTAFRNNRIQTLHLPERTTTIGTRAFWANIEANWFYYSKGALPVANRVLTQSSFELITIPKGVTTIRSEAFGGRNRNTLNIFVEGHLERPPYVPTSAPSSGWHGDWFRAYTGASIPTLPPHIVWGATRRPSVRVYNTLANNPIRPDRTSIATTNWASQVQNDAISLDYTDFGQGVPTRLRISALSYCGQELWYKFWDESNYEDNEYGRFEQYSANWDNLEGLGTRFGIGLDFSFMGHHIVIEVEGIAIWNVNFINHDYSQLNRFDRLGQHDGVLDGGSISLPNNTNTRAGYVFAGWMVPGQVPVSESNPLGAALIRHGEDVNVGRNLEIVALWVPHPYIFQIISDGEGGFVVNIIENLSSRAVLQMFRRVLNLQAAFDAIQESAGQNNVVIIFG